MASCFTFETGLKKLRLRQGPWLVARVRRGWCFVSKGACSSPLHHSEAGVIVKSANWHHYGRKKKAQTANVGDAF